MKNSLGKNKFDFGVIILFTIFIGYSYAFMFKLGTDIFENIFLGFIKEMMVILPAIFIIVGLIDVWVSKETIQSHIGASSGIKGIIYVVIFAAFQGGPLYGVFPVAYLMWKKGSSATNIFIFLAATSTVKIPMLALEIGFMGVEFTILRVVITLPIFIVVGTIMGKYFDKNSLEVNEG